MVAGADNLGLVRAGQSLGVNQLSRGAQFLIDPNHKGDVRFDVVLALVGLPGTLGFCSQDLARPR